ncbi:MAG TPA: S1 RNA-binding domain-containing protein [archaeon]|nr:S1 RNA-binding domain-containing protein [archaeon]
MVKKRGLPQPGELVICKISKINPHSAFAYLEEYDTEGMIHISEVYSGWVKDIRNFVKTGQTVVAKVTRVEDGHISLSLKRVDRKQENNKTKEYRLNQRAEKMLQMVAASMKKTLDKAYEEVGYALQENFGSLYEAFKISIQTPQALRERGVPEKWVEQIRAVAEKSIVQKEFEFKARLFVRSYKTGGLAIVKDILSNAEKSGLEVKYISAPEYMVKFRTMNAKKGEREFAEKLKAISSKDAEISFELVER